MSYQGLGHYEPPKKDNGLLVAIVLAVVALVGVTATLLFVEIKDTTPGTALAVASPSGTTKPKDPLQPGSTGTPKVAGWKVIPLNNGGTLITDKAYDVPPQDWLAVPSALVTFGDHAELSLVAPAIYKQGYCPGSSKSWRSMSGMVVAPNKGNIAVGAAAMAQSVANTVFTTKAHVQPTTEIGDPQPVTILRSKKAVVVTAKLTIPVTDQDVCATPSVSLAVMMAEPNKPDETDSVTMIAMGDQNFPEATSEQELRQIVTSFHDFS